MDQRDTRSSAALFYVPSLLWYVLLWEEGQRKWLAASVVAFGLAILCGNPTSASRCSASGSLTRPTGGPSLSFRLKRSCPNDSIRAGSGRILAVRFAVLGRLSWKHPYMAQVPDSVIWMTVPYVVVATSNMIAPFHLSLLYGTLLLEASPTHAFYCRLVSW
jgi:hypothetical protein